MLNVCGERRVLMAAPFHLRNKAREISLDAIIPVLELFFLFLFPLPVFPGQWETVLRVFCREKRLGEQLAGGWNHQTYKSFKRNDIAAISFFFHRQLCAPPLRGWRRKKKPTSVCPIGKWIVFFRHSSVSGSVTLERSASLVVISLASSSFFYILLDGRTDTVMKSFQGSLKSNRNGLGRRGRRRPRVVLFLLKWAGKMFPNW